MKSLAERLHDSDQRKKKRKSSKNEYGKTGPGYVKTHTITIDGIKVQFFTELHICMRDYPGGKIVNILKRMGLRWDGAHWILHDFGSDHFKKIITGKEKS